MGTGIMGQLPAAYRLASHQERHADEQQRGQEYQSEDSAEAPELRGGM